MKAQKISLYISIIIYCAILGSCTSNQAGKSQTYYVSPGGDDDSPGTKDQPFRTIDRVNTLNLNPGDAVLFRAGHIFEGTILLDSTDSGKEGQDVVIASYPEGRATIDGGMHSALRSDGCSHLLIQNLEFSGDGRNNGNTENGIFINNGENIHVDNVETSGFQHSGLRLHICDNSKITNVYAHDNGFAGIHVTGTTINDPVNYDNQNLYIGYCVAENNPGDPTITDNHSGNGILASSVEGGIIEYCEAFNNGWDMPWDGNGPVGIWIWDCTDFIIQFCISYDNRTHPDAADGGGFDFDGGVSNSIIQYCLSYHNEGCGFGLYEFGAAKPWKNNIVRYNISQDDGIINGGSVGIWRHESRGTMRNCEIYNNTFYNSNPNGPSLWVYNNWPGFNFRNNIFIYDGSLVYPGQKIETELFQGNCFWNLKGNPEIQGFSNLEEWAKATGNEIIDDLLIGLFIDPELQYPGTLDLTDPEIINLENLSGYILKPGSPLINKGLNLKEMFELAPGSQDIVGTSIPSGTGYDIGAIEYIRK